MKPFLFRDTVSVKKVLLYHLYILMIALSPILISMLAGFIGYCMGCNINEGGTDNCIRIGVAFGNILNPLGTLFWLSIITIPLGAIATIALIIIAVHDTACNNRS
jgi:hypothetical protein